MVGLQFYGSKQIYITITHSTIASVESLAGTTEAVLSTLKPRYWSLRQ